MNPFQAMFSGTTDNQINQSMSWASPRFQQAYSSLQQKVGNKNKKAGETLSRINDLFTGASNMLRGGAGFAQNMRNIGNLGMNALGSLGSVMSSFSQGGASAGFNALGNAAQGLFNEGKNVYNNLGYADGRQNQQATPTQQSAVPTPPPLPSGQSTPMQGGQSSLNNSITGFDRSTLRPVTPNSGGGQAPVDTNSQIRNFDRGSLRHVTPNQYQGGGVNNGAMDEQFRRQRNKIGYERI